jgi:3-oxoacyl-[acyl-carrier protein] reductase/meso-butanediol dehydrogenase/(S,S)-butanediol dehydrogenase/diacetyl reductase
VFSLTGLTGKVAVVTGAGRMVSIGRSTAVAFAKAGCDVVITGSGRAPDTYPPEEKAAGWRDIESLADEIRSHGVRALPLVVDVSDEAAVDNLLAQTLSAFGRVDFVVNSAAGRKGADRQPVVDVPLEAWEYIFRINVRGVMLVSRAFARQLIAQGEGGSIVNISSVGGKLFPRGIAAYAASKAAVNALSAVMAGELGPNNIRVNAVCPGRIDTSRITQMNLTEAQRQQMVSRIPLGRAGTGEDIANLTVYLCSDEGAWITGQAINVDGGLLMQH